MNKKRRGKAVAVIDIGSSLIQMRVSQLCDGAITDIDVLDTQLKSATRCFPQEKSALTA